MTERDRIEYLKKERVILKDIVHAYIGIADRLSNDHNVTLSNKESLKITELERKLIELNSYGDLTL